MNLSDQLKNLRKGAEIHNHKVFNRIAESLSDKIKAETGIEMAMVGKTVSGTEIKAALIGQTIDVDDSVKEKVEKVMQDIKNQSNFEDLLE